MSDAFEDRLRAHFAGKTAHVQADPDPGALMERSVGRSGRRRPLAIGAVSLAVILAGSGVLTGVDLVGGRSTATPLAAAPSTTVPGRAGASLAPNSAGEPNLPAIAGQTPYTFLFTRTTSSSVTIRVFGSGSSTTGGCTSTVPCPPVGRVPGSVPCPQGAVCAQPLVTPHAQSGTTGGGSAAGEGDVASGSAVGTPETVPPQPTRVGTTGSGTSGTVPPQPAAECGQLVLELSTNKAVGSGSVPRPTTAAPSPDAVEILGVGSFGTEEGASVGWVAVWVGSGVASVHLSSGDTLVDAMAPSSSIVVLAVPGDAVLAGATVVGVDQSGAAVATVPADQVSTPETSIGCTTLPTNPPSTTLPTTTTAAPTITAPTITAPTTTTTTPTTSLPTTTNTSVTS